jgi:hypothetical protein
LISASVSAYVCTGLHSSTRVVTYLTAEAGIRQFLDLGSGVPSAQNVHEAGGSIAPQSRVV